MEKSKTQHEICLTRKPTTSSSVTTNETAAGVAGTATTTIRSRSFSSRPRPLTSSFSRDIVIDRKCEKNVAITQMLKYKPPVIHAAKPKSLNGPFSVYDIPEIRDVVKSYKHAHNSKKASQEVSRQLYDDLSLNEPKSPRNKHHRPTTSGVHFDYLTPRSTRHGKELIATKSFYSAVEVYFPSSKKNKPQQNFSLTKNNKQTLKQI